MSKDGHGRLDSPGERTAEPLLPQLPRRYQPLSVLGHGGMGEVYRVHDRLRGQQVALKHVRNLAHGGTTQLTAADFTATWQLSGAAGATLDGRTQPAPSDGLSHRQTRVAVEQHSRMAIANEFRTLASLRHPHIISVLDYGFDAEGAPFFTMELLPDAQPFTLGASLRDPAVIIEHTAQLFSALGYLHRHGILHRDIKPSNVLLARGRVKVLDFGVATHASLVHDVAGTLEYMAPELLLGEHPSAASDLYAVGVLLWEALTGEYPFARDSATQFLIDVLGPRDSGRLPPHIEPLLRRPGWSMLPLSSQWGRPAAGAQVGSPVGEPSANPRREQGLARIPEALRELVNRLLQRDPLARFESAEAAADALSRATGFALHGLLRTTRESLLSAAPFLGRDRELSRLQEALAQARAGHGSLLLLGGESGVGKSRLVEELRSLALVAGTAVFSGQAAAEGHSPLSELAQALRPLCVQIDLDDESAAILAELIPDLAALLGRPLPVVPRLDSGAAQGRLLATIETLLRGLRNPSVLILEDAQWAASETVALLQRLQPHLPGVPLLIVVSYREDEAADLPRSLPAAELLPVRRLDAGAVAELARAMLGPRGSNPALLQQLQRESEGNTLFLIEVTRALAEETAGGDATVPRPGESEMPGRLATLTGGMRALLARRLRRVPERDQSTLQLLAVAGRAVDQQLLRRLCPDPDAFLITCAEAGVLEVQEDSWRFSHDKLRETLLAELPPAEAQRLHRTLANESEGLYGDSAEHAAAIAHHFEQACELGRALHYAVLAGEHALRRGAPVEAERILATATRSLPREELPQWQTVRALRLHAQALAALGRMAGCIEACLRGLAVLGEPVPASKAGLVAGVLWQAGGQLRRLVYPLPLSSESPLLRQEAAQLLALVGEASVFELQHLRTAYCMLASTNAADDCQAVEQQIYGYGTVALLLSLTPLRRAAPGYFARAQALLQGSPRSVPRAEVELHRLRALVQASSGQLHAALAESTIAVQAATKLKDGPLRMASLIVRRMSHMHLGDFATALRDGEEIAQLAREGHHVQQLTWALTINALLFLRMGELGRAHLELAEAAESVKHAMDQAARCAVDALRAQLRLRQGHAEGCLELLVPTIKTLLAAKVTVPGLLVCFRGLLDTGLAWLEQPGGDRRVVDAELAVQLAQLGQRLQRYARANPLARPAASLSSGQLALQAGEFEAAYAALGRALRIATAMQMPFDEAEAHEALARLGGRWPALRRRPPGLDAAAIAGHVATAQALYERLGAAWHVSALAALSARPAG